MACLHVGSAVHHGRLHDLTPDFCKGLTFDPFRANSQLQSIHAPKRRGSSARTLALSHRLRRPRPFWTSLTASTTNSITYNYLTAQGPGDKPVRDGSPGPE